MGPGVPYILADAGRWIGEMEEIAATFRGTGVTGGFHDGAAEVIKYLPKPCSLRFLVKQWIIQAGLKRR